MQDTCLLARKQSRTSGRKSGACKDGDDDVCTAVGGFETGLSRLGNDKENIVDKEQNWTRIRAGGCGLRDQRHGMKSAGIRGMNPDGA